MVVVETGRFLQDAKAILSDSDRTGGVRKIRRGARVIYSCHDESYGKNEKANLAMAERNAMKRLIPVLVAGYAAKDRRRR